jgi:hypothetical protein
VQSFRRLAAWFAAFLRKVGVLAIPVAVLAIVHPPVGFHAAAARAAMMPLVVAALALSAILAIVARER